MGSEGLEDARYVALDPFCEPVEGLCGDLPESSNSVVGDLVDKHKDDKAEGVEDSQPQRDEDADCVDVWLMKLAKKQICALHVLKEAAQSLSEALLQGVCQEKEDLLELNPMFRIF